MCKYSFSTDRNRKIASPKKSERNLNSPAMEDKSLNAGKDENGYVSQGYVKSKVYF